MRYHELLNHVSRELNLYMARLHNCFISQAGCDILTVLDVIYIHSVRVRLHSFKS